MLNIQGYQSASPALAQLAMNSQPALSQSVSMGAPFQPNVTGLSGCGMGLPGSQDIGELGEILKVVLTAVFEFVTQIISQFVGGESQPHILGSQVGVAPTVSDTESGERSSGGWLETGKDIFNGIKDIWGMFSGGDGGSGGSYLGTAAKVIGSFF